MSEKEKVVQEEQTDDILVPEEHDTLADYKEASMKYIRMQALKENTPAILIAVVLCGAVVATGYYIFKKKFLKKGTDSEEREIAYSYEDAVEKAKARVDSGKDDGVKLVSDDDKPSLVIPNKSSDILDTRFEDVAVERKAYNKPNEESLSTEYSEKISTLMYATDSDTENEPEFKKIDDSVVGQYFRISEEKYAFENPYNRKVHCIYIPNKHELYTNDGSSFDDEELKSRIKTLYEDPEHETSYFFTDGENAIDYEIEIDKDLLD